MNLLTTHNEEFLGSAATASSHPSPKVGAGFPVCGNAVSPLIDALYQQRRHGGRAAQLFARVSDL